MGEREKSRILLRENPDITFEEDPHTHEVTMMVCNEPLTKKHVASFNEKNIRKIFEKEIQDNRDIVCPTNMGEQYSED
jgi:hypothetical protein